MLLFASINALFFDNCTVLILISIACTNNCDLCFGTLSNECVKCSEGFIMEGFECKQEQELCSSNLGFLDEYDRICKSTLYDTDFPCRPGTYNQFQESTNSNSCRPCDIGNLCPLTFRSLLPDLWGIDFQRSMRIRILLRVIVFFRKALE